MLHRKTGVLYATAVIGLLLISGSPLPSAIAQSAADSKSTAPPSTQPAKRLVILDDVPYRGGESKAWRLDLAMLESADATLRPAIVIIHGGGWRSGSKRDRAYRDLLLHFAVKGYVAVSVDYRLTGEAPMPACVEDVKCAVRWLRANADQYRVDPQRIGAYGHSAGAHLALMLAMCPSGVGEGDGGWNEYSSKITSVVGGSTPTALRANMPDATKWSPTSYISAELVPMLLIHGTADTTVAIAGVDEFVDKVKAAGAKDVTYIRVDGANHGVVYEHFLDRTQSAMDQFFARTLKPG